MLTHADTRQLSLYLSRTPSLSISLSLQTRSTRGAPKVRESRRPQPLFFLGGGGKIALVSVPIALVSAACHFRKADLRHANKSMQMRTREILCSCATSWGMQIKLTVLTILTMLNIP